MFLMAAGSSRTVKDAYYSGVGKHAVAAPSGEGIAASAAEVVLERHWTTWLLCPSCLEFGET